MKIKNKNLSEAISRAKIKRAIKIYGTILDHPILKRQFLESNKIKPEDVPLSATEIIIKWKCHKCNHVWTASPGSRCYSFIWPKSKNKKDRKVSECIKCYMPEQIKKRVKSVIKKKGSLLDNYPEICKLWDYKKNTKKPSEITMATNYVAWWICKRHGSFPKRPQQLIRKKEGCPKCTSNIFSKSELRLYCEIKHIFKNTIWNSWTENYQIDVFIKDYNIGFEQDGHYHLKTFKRDSKKNKFFQKKGVKIIRLRDLRLKKKISSDDFFIDTNKIKIEDVKKALKKITKYRKIKKSERKKIQNYLKLNKFRNDKLFNKEIQLSPIVRDKNNLKINFPLLCKDWDYKKNKSEKPEFFFSGSDVKVWWKCLKKPKDYPTVVKFMPKTYKYVGNHPSFKQQIKDRTGPKKTGCPICAIISARFYATKKSIKNKGSLKDHPRIYRRIKSLKVRNNIKNFLHEIPAASDRIKFEFYCKIHNHTWTSDLYRAYYHGCRLCGNMQARKTFQKTMTAQRRH